MPYQVSVYTDPAAADLGYYIGDFYTYRQAVAAAHMFGASPMGGSVVDAAETIFKVTEEWFVRVQRFDVPKVRVKSAEYFHRLTRRLQARLPAWVIYSQSTVEFPGYWVARMHVTLPTRRPTRFVMTHDSLDGLRGLLPPWLRRIARDPADAPEIIEVWL